VGRAQKLKQKRKEEEAKRREERKKELRRRAVIIAASLLAVAVTVFLVLLVNRLKEEEQKGDGPDPVEQAAQLDREVPAVPDEVGVPNLRGGVGMAKPSDPSTQEPIPNSATSEFYILKQDAPSLDADFTVFGRVSSGMEVVDGLEAGDDLYSAEVRDGGDEGKDLVLSTSKGEIVIHLLEEKAPATVQHVVDLVESGFYQGLVWYRVEDWVVQTGSHLRSVQWRGGG
jgi:cyclophilin family peptidyl-prolyl cis-trans isomerase